MELTLTIAGLICFLLAAFSAPAPRPIQWGWLGLFLIALPPTWALIQSTA